MNPTKNSQSSGMSSMCEILKIGVSIESITPFDEELDAPLVNGMLDFLDLKPGEIGNEINTAQIEASVPKRLIRNVLKRCARGGMTKTAFDDALTAVCETKPENSKSDCPEKYRAWCTYIEIQRLNLSLKTGAPHSQEIYEMGKTADHVYNLSNKCRSWSRYYYEGQQMRIKNMRNFIWLAECEGWLDKRKKPSDPHPSEWNWESPRPEWMNRSIRRWVYYERTSEVDKFMGRIDAIEACIALVKSDKQVTLDSVRDYFCFEQVFRRKYVPILGLASVSQKLRIVRGDETLKQRFDSSSDAHSKLVEFLLDTDDPIKAKKNKEIASTKKIKREVLKSRRKM